MEDMLSPLLMCFFEQVLLRRFQITRNLSLDGVLDFLNSKKMTDASTLDLIDDEDSDVEEGIDRQTRENLGLGLLDQWQIVEDP
jgi:periodic tryptophan protein 2